MVKTTTLNHESSLPETATPSPVGKKLSVVAKKFGASDYTIQNILNYSKSLQVIELSKTDAVLGVMN